MTARADSLTDRATTPVVSPAGTFTVSASDVRALIKGLRALGYDVDPLLAAAGVRESDFADPDARLSCQTYGAIFGAAQRQRFTPNLTLALAQTVAIGDYPLLDYLVVTADSVEAAVRQLGRYLRLVLNATTIEPHEVDGDIRVGISNAPSPLSIEYLCSLIVLHLRSETERGTATSVAFAHAPDDTVAFSETLGCPVHARSSWSGVTFSKTAWSLPLRRRDPALRQLLESQAAEAIARLPQRSGVAFDVQRGLASRVAGGDVTIASIARDLGLSGRTLQRRLADEGVSFQELLDNARKSVAMRLLRDPSLAIGEVAYLVGYSEPAAFHRAFKRWCGMTVDGFRRTAFAGSSTSP